MIKILVGVFTGTVLCAGLARYVIAKSLADLDQALEMGNSINLRLAVITTKLEALDALVDLVQDHDRKISSLEARRERRN